MRRSHLLAVLIGFAVLRAQAFASPPVAPPTEGFTITSNSLVLCDGTVTESERFHWIHFEGEGNLRALFGGPDAAGHPLILVPGFQEGAEVVYEQEFKSVGRTPSLLKLKSVAGYYTLFAKNFLATSHETPNLAVHRVIGFNADPATNGFATQTEKVGLSVVSSGGGNSDLEWIAEGLLSLCPWATGSGREIPGYPATNEGIAAGSSFMVTRIQGFQSDTRVVSTDSPSLSYGVSALSGQGFMAAGFVVELWEGATRWGSHDAGVHGVGQVPTGNRAIDGRPPIQSRTSYAEHATATGVWAFSKNVSYQSTMAAASTQDGIVPFVRVP